MLKRRLLLEIVVLPLIQGNLSNHHCFAKKRIHMKRIFLLLRLHLNQPFIIKILERGSIIVKASWS